VAFFGETYGRESAGAFPPFLLRLRDRVAEWAGIDPVAFAMALINEYRPGTPIGWHRDAPQYDVVAGVSLLSACRKIPAIHPPERARVSAGTAERHARDRPGAAIRVPDDRSVARGLRAPYSRGEGAEVFDHVSHVAAVMAVAG